MYKLTLFNSLCLTISPWKAKRIAVQTGFELEVLTYDTIQMNSSDDRKAKSSSNWSTNEILVISFESSSC